MDFIGILCAEIAQLGERQTEDLKVPGSIPGLGIFAIKSAGICMFRTYVTYCLRSIFMCPIHLMTAVVHLQKCRKFGCAALAQLVRA